MSASSSQEILAKVETGCFEDDPIAYLAKGQEQRINCTYFRRSGSATSSLTSSGGIHIGIYRRLTSQN
jgi:hypothetical protein